MYSISENLGMSYSTIYNIINSEYLDNKKLATIEKISDFLDISIVETYINLEREEETKKRNVK